MAAHSERCVFQGKKWSSRNHAGLGIEGQIPRERRENVEKVVIGVGLGNQPNRLQHREFHVLNGRVIPKVLDESRRRDLYSEIGMREETPDERNGDECEVLLDCVFIANGENDFDLFGILNEGRIARERSFVRIERDALRKCIGWGIEKKGALCGIKREWM